MVVKFITSACVRIHASIITSLDAVSACFNQLIDDTQADALPTATDYHQLNSELDSDENPLSPPATKLTTQTICYDTRSPSDTFEYGEDQIPDITLYDSGLSSGDRVNGHPKLVTSPLVPHLLDQAGLCLSPRPEIFSGRIEDLYGTGGKINAQINFYPTPRHEPIPEYSKPLLSEYGSA